MIEKNRKWFALGGVLMVIPYIFWYYLGQDAFVLIHDNLDSEFVYIKHILENDTFFNLGFSDKIEGVMNGVPRMFLRSGLNFTILLFALFPPIIAYITNHLFVHFIGYLGMFLFLNKVMKIQNPLILLVSSISFGMVSYYHIQYGISISGQPLLLYAFYQVLRNKDNFAHWVIIILFPFFSFIVGTIPFFIPFLILLGALEFYKNRRLPKKYIMSILLMVGINLLVEYQLVYATLIDSTIISHRVEVDNTAFLGVPDWNYFLNTLKTYFTETQYHSGTFKTWPIIVLFGTVLLLFRKKVKPEILLVAGLIILINLWVASNLSIIGMFAEGSFPRSFNSERFYFILPFLWLLMGAILLRELFLKNNLLGYLGIVGSLIVFNGIIKNNQEFQMNARILKGENIDQPTFRQFYAQDLFSNIKEEISPYKENSEYFLSVGLHPSIAQFNGLSSLDSYQNNYDLKYKKMFREMMVGELTKNKGNMKYFDSWGSRCYLFSSEIGRKYTIPKESTLSIKSMVLDVEKFKAMGGKYILSSIPIVNHNILGFHPVGQYSNKDSYFNLHLYRLND